MKNQSRLKYTRSIIGLINVSYHTMVRNSLSRNLPAPEMTKKQFSEWILKHEDFPSLYENWKKSDFDKWKRPSIDRLDNSKGYSLLNIRLVTWRENYLARDVTKCGKIKVPFIKGNKFGEWELLEEVIRPILRIPRKWVVQCSCGKIAEVRVSAILQGKSKNCGHARNANIGKPKHGLLKGVSKGGKRPKIYKTWESLKYKGKLCSDWQNFDQFIKCVGFPDENCFLSRKDTKLPFSPTNYYWQKDARL